ncbi:MAG: AAA family ATPase [Deferribacteraceae bacterium]|jgi:predicted ATPase|nr:AAA family ATPase [Deferribacteraceae bacterium]
MLQRLYVHNYRCLQNFEIKAGEEASLLFVGKNGVGKSTIASVLSIFNKLGSGQSNVDALLTAEDFTLGRINEQMHFEIDVLLDGNTYNYRISFDMPNNSKLRVIKEDLFINAKAVFERTETQIVYNVGGKISEFPLDVNSVAFTLLINTSSIDAPWLLRAWFATMLILKPIPQLMRGDSDTESVFIESSCKNFAPFLLNLLNSLPASYSTIEKFLKKLMPDFVKFSNPGITSTRILMISFGDGTLSYQTSFSNLSDGEKCIFLAAVVLAVQEAYHHPFVFWDEPDNYLSISEVQDFIRTLRTGKGQIWMASHNSETINCFSHDNTLLLHRKNHLAPVELHFVSERISSKESTIQKLRLDELG